MLELWQTPVLLPLRSPRYFKMLYADRAKCASGDDTLLKRCVGAQLLSA
jgi:hypothetical protein